MGKDPWGEDVPVYKCVPIKHTPARPWAPSPIQKRSTASRVSRARLTRASGGRAAAAAAAATSFEALGEEEEEEDWVSLHFHDQRKTCATDMMSGHSSLLTTCCVLARPHAQDDEEFPLDPPDPMPFDEDAGGEGGVPMETVAAGESQSPNTVPRTVRV